MPGGFGRGFCWWRGHFRDAGFRITVPRQTILEFLSKTKRHLSAEDIFIEVHKRYPAIGLTTVYRTLELLVNMGLVFKFDFGDGRARYELAEGPKAIEHHHHLICTSCGRVIDYTAFVEQEIELVKKIEKELSRKYSFNINSHQIQFLGMCQECQNK